MDYREKCIVAPGKKVRLSEIVASYTGEHESPEEAFPKIKEHTERMAKLQDLLYADDNQSFLIVHARSRRSRQGRNNKAFVQCYEPAGHVRV